MFWEKYCALCTSVRKAPNVVANEIGIKSSGSVTGWKNGAVPRLSVLKKIADYFDVSVEYLNGDTEKEKSPAEAEDEVTRQLIAFAHSCSPDELREIANYIDFIKSKRR